MKNLIFLLLASILIVSCSSNGNNNDNDYYNLDTDIIFTIKDSNGNDLLNPNNPNAYLSETVKIYYLKENGETEEVYNSNLDASRNFKVITPENSGSDIYAFQLFPNTYIMENAVTYIEWNDTETDTVKTNYRYGDNHTVCNKVWYNDTDVWTENTEINTGRIFEIIKN
tara:strand:- start:27 stop:533 length:507 start_codon:yes stop_codon:yes gene_type:complete